MSLSRFRWMVVLAFSVLTLSPAFTQDAGFDVLIRGAQVLDGTGAPAVRADVGIRGNSIAAVGQLGAQGARRVIDASGLVVAPGFIDLHTHSEMPLVAGRDRTEQGPPGRDARRHGREHLARAARWPAGREAATARRPTGRPSAGYFERLERQGISMNTIAHVASEQVRRVVMGYDARPTTPQELSRMTDLVARSMREGAWGLVTRFESGGPAHPERGHRDGEDRRRPTAATTPPTSAARGSSRRRRLPLRSASPRRRRSPSTSRTSRFAARRTRAPLAATSSKQSKEARKRGLDITANQYPYTAMFHGWSAFFPLWIREGGPQKFAERLKDPAARTRLKQDKDFLTWAKEHGWWEGIVMARARTEKNRQYKGKSVAQEYARMRGEEYLMDTCITLMAEEAGSISGIFHTMGEAGRADGDEAAVGEHRERRLGNKS